MPRPVQRFEGKAAVNIVLEACQKAQMTEVFVVADQKIAEAVSQAVYSTKHVNRGSDYQVLSIDKRVLLDQTRKAANFKMFDVPFGVLELARGLSNTVPAGYDNVVIVSADNVRVTADHIYEVCLDAFEHPEVEAVSSWIEKLIPRGSRGARLHIAWNERARSRRAAHCGARPCVRRGETCRQSCFKVDS